MSAGEGCIYSMHAQYFMYWCVHTAVLVHPCGGAVSPVRLQSAEGEKGEEEEEEARSKEEEGEDEEEEEAEEKLLFYFLVVRR